MQTTTTTSVVNADLVDGKVTSTLCFAGQVGTPTTSCENQPRTSAWYEGYKTLTFSRPNTVDLPRTAVAVALETAASLVTMPVS